MPSFSKLAIQTQFKTKILYLNWPFFWFSLGYRHFEWRLYRNKFTSTGKTKKKEFRLIIFTDQKGNDLLFTTIVEKIWYIRDIHLFIENNHMVFVKPNSLETVFGYTYFVSIVRNSLEIESDCQIVSLDVVLLKL